MWLADHPLSCGIAFRTGLQRPFDILSDILVQRCLCRISACEHIIRSDQSLVPGKPVASILANLRRSKRDMIIPSIAVDDLFGGLCDLHCQPPVKLDVKGTVVRVAEFLNRITM